MIKRAEIIELLFGTEGIVNADDTIDFETKSVEPKTKVQDHPQFINYFDHQLKDRLDSFVNIPRRKNNEMSDKLWTNNNAESINHVFKVAVNWKPQSTPELINKIYDCVDIQILHLRRALHSSGDYVLAPIQEHYRIPERIWRCKSTEDKHNVFKCFLQDKIRKRPYSAMITSTDGKYAVVNKAKTLAKKPGQHKRARTERTSIRK
jgi:hypothetical protein